MAALYGMGRRQQADEILLPLLGAFDRNDFEGRDYLDRSKDWKSANGAVRLRRLLVDNYYALLSVLAREGCSGKSCSAQRQRNEGRRGIGRGAGVLAEIAAFSGEQRGQTGIRD